MEKRLALLRSFLKSKKVDAILLSSPVSIFYYIDFSSFSGLEREGFALVTQSDVSLFTSALYAGAVKNLAGVTPIIYSADYPFSKHLEASLKKHLVKRLGVEGSNLTAAEYESLKKHQRDLPLLSIRNLRIRKSSQEITNIQKACSIADKALEKLIAAIKPGKTEKQLALQLEILMMQAGGEVAFPTIIAFGENAAIPHHKSNDTKLKKNDTVLIDFGAKYQGYCSDMTRTFFMGKPTEEQELVYQTVLTAQQKAIEFLSKNLYSSSEQSGSRSNNKTMKQSNNGVSASDVDQIARDYISSQGLPSIPHSLGHGIGLEVHEPPALSPHVSDTLEEGMVFSIEPGVYLDSNFGVRIEDLFALQGNKLMQLTKFPTTFKLK